jgi:O-antigen ligase
MPSALIPGLLFLCWILLSNFSAATTPNPDNRVWGFTYLQLWMLAWLAALLFDELEHVHHLMWGFVAAALVSAVYASLEGVIGASITTSVRAVGLAGNANAAARYFMIALVFAYFLLTQQKRKVPQLFLMGAMLVLLYGILATVSRTGLILLAGGLGLLFLQGLGGKKNIYFAFFVIGALAVTWQLADNITAIVQSMFGSVTVGTDTVGIRYGLWQAGLRMWADSMVAGVGIGEFSRWLPRYGWDLLAPRYLGLGPHNMYIAVLSETGLVGLFLFMAMFAQSFRVLLSKVNSVNPRLKALAQNWLIIFVLVLLAGVTKQDQYDKLTWLVVGISAAIGSVKE